MAPEEPVNNTAGTDEETIAQRKKRLRRVSFADREITSVHIFNRDEDYETPPNSSASKQQNGEQADTSESEDKVIRFFGELSDHEDTEGDGDAEDEVVVEKSFLRPKGSPSSGGSTVGSVASDDEDNFFGPVSSHFINPGRLSDATISEEHHDITMDSTAFSMHFRSLARSESGDVKTPTSSHLPVDEKTPPQVTSRSDTGSAMVLTKPKKFFPKSPLPVDQGSGGRDSNEMSIVGENSREYDYGYISPALAALLADESKELPPASLDNIVEARSPINDFSLSPQNGCTPIGQVDKDSHGIGSTDAHQIFSPCGSGYHPQIVLQDSGSQRYSKEASLSTSTSRRENTYLVGLLPQSLSSLTPSPKQGGSFMSRATLALVESLSTIQKSKSRLGLIPPSPGSALSQRIEKSKLQLSGYRSTTTPSTIGREEIGIRREKYADIPITNLEVLLSEDDNRTPISEKKGISDQYSSGALIPAVDISDNIRTPISEKKGMLDRSSSGALCPGVDISVNIRTPISEKKGIPDHCSSDALSRVVDTSDNIRSPVSEEKGMPDQCNRGALSPVDDPNDGNRTPVLGKIDMPDQHSCGALSPAIDISVNIKTPVSEKKGRPDHCSSGTLSRATDTSCNIRPPVSEEKGMPDQCSRGALSPVYDTSDGNRTPVLRKIDMPDQHSCGALSRATDTSDNIRPPVSEEKGMPDQCSRGALSHVDDTSDGNRTPVLGKIDMPDQRSCGALSRATDTSDNIRPPVSEEDGIPDQCSRGALSPVDDTSDGNRTPVLGKIDMPDQRSCGALSPAVAINGTSACINPEGNTSADTENSHFKQQQRNQTTSTPEKFGSSLAKSSNAMTLALRNFVTLHDQEQHSKATAKSETEDRNVIEESASNHSINTLSDKVDSLIAESGVLLSETGFLNGSAHQKEKDSKLNKNQNGTNISGAQFLLKDNNHFKVHCETEVILTEDIPAVFTENLPDTSGSSSMDRSTNESSHDKGPSRLKRKAEDADCAVRNHSPKVGRSTRDISNPVLDHPDGNDCHVVCGQVTNWIEIPGKVSEEVSQMLAPLADKFNSRLICKLEDLLTHMKKVHLCEMLCLQIQSQKVCGDLSGAKTKRRAEIRSLLCKLAYEKAKFELLHLKKDIMMKKFQAVRTGVQTSEMLRLNCDNLLRQHGFCSTGLLNPGQAHEATTSKGAEKTLEIKVLDSKIKNCQWFPTSNTRGEESSYVDTIMNAEDDLKRKMSCRYIRQDILGWKIDSLGERNDCQSIVLNYSGLINQRLTLKPGYPSCVLVSNSMSDTFIKNFLDMNVSVPFNSLFNAEDSQKYVGGSDIVVEITQKTSLLLHNLLDVAEEFQLARMNIPDLVQGNFDSPSADQLHLQITFLDSKNLRKVNLILDVTCLIHGKYPGDIIPCEIREVSGVVLKELKMEIESEMDNVGLGYPRILRLCRCISEVLQSQNRKCLQS